MKPILDIDKMRISFSGVSTYLKCPKQYYFRYVEGRKDIPAIALMEGSSHHTAFEKNNRHKMEKSKDLPAKTITDIFMSSLRDRVKSEEKFDWGEDSEDTLFRRAKVWHSDYVNRIAPSIKPEFVEEKFEKEVEVGKFPFILSGVPDLVYSGKVSDYKTTSPYGYTNRKREINDDLQLSYYSFATKCKKVENICLVKKATPEIGVISSVRSKANIEWALQVAKAVLVNIQKEAFGMTNPTNWWCSSLYCGYWKLCRGKYEK